tara:strand:- start:1379 stop:1645 length:267 start_codon:yes stop_codon:yes gene_type:complete
LTYLDDLTGKLVAHHRTRDEQAIVLLRGVQIRTADAAALHRNDYLPGGGRGVVYILNAEGSAWFAEYSGAHVHDLSSGVVYLAYELTV